MCYTINEDSDSCTPELYTGREGDILKAKPKYFEPRPPGVVSDIYILQGPCFDD